MEILNRKANYDYFIYDKYDCGIELRGTEIKSIRLGKANIKDSYVIVKNNELFILNMHISKYDTGGVFNHDETRTRKLLAHKKEIYKINSKLNVEGYTLIPLKLYINDKGKAKVLIGVCKGKKNYDKKETIKERDILRENKKF